MSIVNMIKDLDYTPECRDHYTNQYGVPVPRVTEILSAMMHTDALMYWANNLGLKGQKYKTVLNQAANLGTEAHLAIERYLRDKLMTENNIPFQSFLSWYEFVCECATVEIMMMEERLVCDYFGGTLDALYCINGKIFLVDYKTSNMVTEKYFFQLAAYKHMLAQRGIQIDGCIVLQLCKEEVGFTEYILLFEDPMHASFMDECTETFLALVYAYYRTRRTKDIYSTIF